MIQLKAFAKLFLAISLLFTINFKQVYAQNNELQRKLEFADSIRTTEPDEFKQLLFELRESNHSFSFKQANYYKLLLALHYTYVGNFELAQKNAEFIIDNSTEKLYKIRSMLLIVNISAIKQNWSLGLSYLSESIKLLSSNEPNELRVKTYNIAALFYNQLRQYKLGLKYSNLALELLPEGRELCLSHQAYVESSLFLSFLQVNSPEVITAIEVCDNLTEYVWSGLIRAQIASLHNEKISPNKAISVITPALKQIEETKYPRLLTQIYFNLSQSYFSKKDYKKAKAYALKVIYIGSIIETTRSVVQANYLLYKLEFLDDNFKKALMYHKKYTELTLMYLDVVKIKTLAFQLAEHQAIQKQNEIELLNKQNKLLNVEHSLVKTQAENNQLIMILLVAIITLLAFFGYRSWMTQRRLRTLAEYDYLTKVYNRGHFMTLAEDTVKLAEKAKHTVACIIFDLDKFKNVNDTYGHAVGDWVLKAAVAAVSECIRENDALARLGGEEFIILLPSCDLGAACHVAEKCIETLQLIDTQETGFDFKVTASFGITTSHLSSYNLSSLIADADKALYESKNNGRNQFSVFNDLDK